MLISQRDINRARKYIYKVTNALLLLYWPANNTAIHKDEEIFYFRRS